MLLIAVKGVEDPEKLPKNKKLIKAGNRSKL